MLFLYWTKWYLKIGYLVQNLYRYIHHKTIWVGNIGKSAFISQNESFLQKCVYLKLDLWKV